MGKMLQVMQFNMIYEKNIHAASTLHISSNISYWDMSIAVVAFW